MAVVHFFWQKIHGKKNTTAVADTVGDRTRKGNTGGRLVSFRDIRFSNSSPILLLIVVYIIRSVTGSNVDISVEVASLLSFLIAIVCEIIRTRDTGKVLKQTEDFFKGMGNSMPIVALLVAASVFVLGLNSIGLINALQTAMLGVQGSGMGFVLPLIFNGSDHLDRITERKWNCIVLCYGSVNGDHWLRLPVSQRLLFLSLWDYVET